MKVLEVYDKNSDLKYRNVSVFKRMDDFFKKYPSEYGENYYRNLETLKIFKVDEVHDGADGEYFANDNTLLYRFISAVGHELMHMASWDQINKNMAFLGNSEFYGMGLMEGMTEYLSMKAFNRTKPIAYPFETFCVSMLSEIDGIFKPYFIPNEKEFINLFSNKRDIYSLMYSLEFYHDEVIGSFNSLILGTEPEVKEETLQSSIRDTINSLISIELGYEKDSEKLKLYSEKFMDLISSDIVDYYLDAVYPNYINYANRQIKKRIKR